VACIFLEIANKAPVLEFEIHSMARTAHAVHELYKNLGRETDIQQRLVCLRALLKTPQELLPQTSRALSYLAQEDLTGFTARQIQIPGFGTKWIEQNRALVRAALGFDPIAHTENRTTRVAITYADPEYLALPQRRRFDSVVLHDHYEAPYAPACILITENNECADRVPPFPRLIAARGDGKNIVKVIQTLTEFFPGAPFVYWGDIDEEGLSILSHVREHYPEIQSILMDLSAWKKYRHLGTKIAHSNEIQFLNRAAPLLNAEEQAALLAITNPDSQVLRIEQERIPRADIVEAFKEVLG
jgi:hypothetical protein